MSARRWTVLTLLATVLAAGSSVITAADAGATNVLGQAGYVVAGPLASLHSLSAQWRVPAVEAHSGAGRALTYISALDSASGFEIEVGTIESATAAKGRSTASYTVFWGETRSYPQSAPTRAARSLGGDDLVRATIRLVYSGWQLALEDLTRHWTWSKTLPLVGFRFDDASYLQEDPPAATAPDLEQARDMAYPRLAQVVFSRVLLNGGAAKLGGAAARALAVPNGPYLVPADARAGTFAVVAASGFARQYLADIAPYDIGYGAYVYAYSSWNGSASAAARDAAAVRPFIAGATSFADRAASQRWPAPVRPSVDQLVAVMRQLALEMHRVDTLTGSSFGSWHAAVDALLARTTPLTRAIRAEVGLPPAA